LRLAAPGTMTIPGTQERTRYLIFDPAAQATSMKSLHVYLPMALAGETQGSHDQRGAGKRQWDSVIGG
jgi:hypothetical protein